jgi:hypothetical protein
LTLARERAMGAECAAHQGTGEAMGYALEEYPENGDKITLGEPFADVMIAKVIASQRARRTGRIIVVTDQSSGCEVARYEPGGASIGRWVERMRAVDDLRAVSSESSTRRKLGA